MRRLRRRRNPGQHRSRYGGDPHHRGSTSAALANVPARPRRHSSRIEHVPQRLTWLGGVGGKVVHIDALGVPWAATPACRWRTRRSSPSSWSPPTPRLPGGQVGARLVIDVPELGVTIRVVLALGDLRVRLQRVALGLQQRPPSAPSTRGRRRPAPAPAPGWTSRPPQRPLRIPRASGSTISSSAGSSPGSVSVTGLRPPPGARVRGSDCPATSRASRATMSGWTRVAAAATLMPRRPAMPPQRPAAPAAADHPDAGRHGEHPGASVSVAWMPIGRACQQSAFTVSDV
jgi:hypothetical protein